MAETDCISDLLTALVQCFGIILIGYIAGNIRKFSSLELKGLNNFTQYFSLPALIFSSLATLDFQDVNWIFMASILISKVAVFAIVALATMVITRPADIAKAGLYAILATQSNDFALGYPLIEAVYEHHHPEYKHYIYFLAPIQLVILNPIGFLLIELQRQTNERNTNIIWSVLKGTFTNPVVIMTILGIIANQVFHQQLPFMLYKMLEVLGSAYSATALFLLGISLVAKFGKLSRRTILIPIVLIAAKILLLPIIIQKTVLQLTKYGASSEESNDLSSFGFLYGTFPFAPAAYLYATHYKMSTNVASTGMVMCTVLAAPFMAVSASMVSFPQTGLTLLKSDLLQTKIYSSIVTLIFCLWIAISFMLRKKWKLLTHKATLFILAAQSLLAIEGILSSFTKAEYLFALKLLYIGSLSMLRIWAAILAVTLLFMHWRSICFVIRLNFFLTILGIVLPLSVTAAVFIVNRKEEKALFEYGTLESYIMLTTTAISLIITALCIGIQQRHFNNQANYEPIEPTVNIASTQTECTHIDIEDICHENETPSRSPRYNMMCSSNSCSPEQRKNCSMVLQHYQDSVNNNNSELHVPGENNDLHDVHHHVLFLSLLGISMVVSVAISVWVLYIQTSTGISVELQFMDILLIYGQGIITFFVFEVDFNYISHFCTNIYRRLRHSNGMVILPDVQSLSQLTQNISQQFRVHHQQRISAYCGNSVVPFPGKQLVDSLLVYGLVQSRTDGEQYGEHLLLGRVIQHIEKKHHFKDNMLLYEFVNEC